MSELILPQLAHYPDAPYTSGREFGELYAYAAGHAIDGWQQWILDKGLAEDLDGKWAAFQVGQVVARQNGKDEIFAALGLGWLFLTGDMLIGHSAHEYKTAMEAFRRLVSLITNMDDLRKKVKKIINTNGEEGIEMQSGARMRFLARSKGAGRGFSFDKMIWNEAYALVAAQVEAVLPTMSARPNPQLWLGSSPPLDAGTGEALFQLRRLAQAKAKGVAFFGYGPEWSLDKIQGCANENCTHVFGVAEGCVLDDRELWAAYNPAFPHRISEEAIERERATMAPSGFARERFSAWPPDLAEGFTVIGKAQWDALKDIFSGGTLRGDMDSGAEQALRDGQFVGRPVFAVAVSSRKHGPVRFSIALAWRRQDGKAHLELVLSGAGTAAIPDALAKLKVRHDPAAVIIDPGSPAGSVIADVQAKGVEVTPMTTQNVAQAFGMIYDAATSTNPDERTVVHIGQPEPTLALQGAGTRDVGDGRAWDVRKAGTDITSIDAMTKALWGLAQQAAQPEKVMPWVMYG